MSHSERRHSAASRTTPPADSRAFQGGGLTKSPWLQAAIFLGCLVTMNAGIRYFARNTAPRQALRAIDHCHGCTDVFIGNSTLHDALNLAVYEAAAPGRKAVDATLCGSTPLEHFLLLRCAAEHCRPKRIFVGFDETSATDPPTGGWSVMHDSRAMACYTDRELALPYYAADDPIAAWQVRLASLAPMVYDRFRVWQQLVFFRERLSRIGLVPRPRKPFYENPPAANEPELREAIEARYRHVLDSRIGLSAPVRDMFAAADRVAARLIFVRVAESDVHRRIYNTPSAAEYLRYVTSLLEARGAICIYAQHWFKDNEFNDWIHVNREAAAEFSRRLATTPLETPSTESKSSDASIRAK